MNSLIGHKLGDFQLEALLGKGNVGSVYRALQVSTGEPAAVKILHPHAATHEDLLKRIRKQVELAEARHAGIAHIFETGEKNGVIYIAMEFLPDGPLCPPPALKPISQDSGRLIALLDLFRHVADTLAIAHKSSFLHLDLHPNNILLRGSGRGEFEAKLVDFGLVHALHGDTSPSAEFRGNPGYMAPEQWRGGEVDMRTDLYSLGVILYQIATGMLPFLDTAPATAMYNHLYVAPPSPRRLQPELHPALESIIMRCLSKQPRDRFASASELARALLPVLSELREEPDSAAFAQTVGGGAVHALREAPFVPRQEPPDLLSLQPDLKHLPGIPRIQVADARGVMIRRGYLQSSGATIGSANDNVICLDANDVSPHHARIDWDGRRITLTDLGSRTSTFLNDQRLLPQIPQDWISGQQARIGAHWLSVEHSSPDVPRADVIDIIVDHSKRKMTLTPGKPEECRVTIANHKTIVDHFCLAVAGIPAEWVRSTGVEIALNPYDKKDIVLQILVPKAPTSTAGDYDVVIRAESVANPDDPGEAKVQWTVAGFDSAALVVNPSKVSGRKRGRYSVSLHNEGNRPASYDLTAVDDDRILALEFETAAKTAQLRPQLALAPGAKAAVRLAAEAPKRNWVGSALRHGFQIQAAQHGTANAHIAEAKFIQQSVFPTWMIAAAAVLLAVLFVVVPRVGRPSIRSIEIDPPSPLAGEPVSIIWNAVRARNVEIRPVKAGIAAGQGSFRVLSGFEKETVLTVIASNALGSDQREVAVLVRPRPAAAPLGPSQVELSVSRSSIAKGRSVTISWAVTGGTSAEFNLTGAVPLHDSYVDSPDKDQTYTITAYNAANLPTKKSITVKVIEEAPAPPPKPRLAVDKNLIHQGQLILLTWTAKGAKDVRIDSTSPTPLAGTSGQKQARLKGKGRYTFTVVSTNEAGAESKSDPVVVDVQCTLVQKSLKLCADSPQIEWR